MRRKLLIPFLCGAALCVNARQPAYDATVSVRLNAAGVHASFNLDHSVRRFEFSKVEVVRREDIEVLTPGVEWNEDGTAVLSEHPFRRFEMQIKPAARERDAKYPAFFRVGLGGVLHGKALKAGVGWRTHLRVITERGDTRAPAGKAEIERSVFIGPTTYVTHGAGADFIASPDTPVPLRERVVKLVTTAQRMYAAHLQVAPATQPTVVMAQSGAGGGFTGDVSSGPFISLRFYGEPQDQLSDANSYRLTHFIMHEAFHLWNGELVSSRSEDTASWLHEGSADYAALLTSLELGALDDAGMRAELGSALERCRQGLERQNNVGLNELKVLSSNVRYPCGIVIQWAASMSSAGAGRGGFFDIWSRMIAVAMARTDREYTLGDFYASTGVDGKTPPEAIRLITSERGPARWKELTTALATLGAEVTFSPTNDSRRQRMLFHLLEQACGPGPRGFYTESRIRLQTNKDCVLIPDNSILISVEGGDIAAVDEATYSAVQARCAAQEDVRILLEGDRNVSIPCHKELIPPRDSYIVNRWH